MCTESRFLRAPAAESSPPPCPAAVAVGERFFRGGSTLCGGTENAWVLRVARAMSKGWCLFSRGGSADHPPPAPSPGARPSLRSRPRLSVRRTLIHTFVEHTHHGVPLGGS